MPYTELSIGHASRWNGSRDTSLIFTHPYAPLPTCLRTDALHPKKDQSVPMILNLYMPPGRFEERLDRLSVWTGEPFLVHIGNWGRGHRNSVFVNFDPGDELNLPRLDDLIEDPFEEGKGWMPVELPLRVLRWYLETHPIMGAVWDGFCGRGTIGKACQILGLSYIGVDIDPERIRLASSYLGARWETS